jgi:hypothetical protein
MLSAIAQLGAWWPTVRVSRVRFSQFSFFFYVMSVMALKATMLFFFTSHYLLFFLCSFTFENALIQYQLQAPMYRNMARY